MIEFIFLYNLRVSLRYINARKLIAALFLLEFVAACNHHAASCSEHDSISDAKNSKNHLISIPSARWISFHSIALQLVYEFERYRSSPNILAVKIYFSVIL